jgi:hypothetical protein
MAPTPYDSALGRSGGGCDGRTGFDPPAGLSAGPGLSDPAAEARVDGIGAAPAAVAVEPLVAAAVEVAWSAAVNLRGSRTLDVAYPVAPPLLTEGQLPRVVVRSVSAAPAFTLDLRRPTRGALLFVGVLRYTDGRGWLGVVRVAGTWSPATAGFWGTWMGAANQRGTVAVTLRQA